MTVITYGLRSGWHSVCAARSRHDLLSTGCPKILMQLCFPLLFLSPCGKFPEFLDFSQLQYTMTNSQYFHERIYIQRNRGYRLRFYCLAMWFNVMYVIVSHNNKARQQYYCPAQSRWVSLSVTTETTGRGRQCCAVPGSPAVFAPRIWLCSGGPHAATRRGGQSYLQNLVKLCLRIVVNRCKCRIISFHAHFRINSQLKMSKFGRIPDDTGR